MPSTNVNDYPTFREYAARFGADQALWARLGIEWRSDQVCKAARARMKVGERARRGRYGEQVAAEVARATASRAAWETCVREHQRLHAEAEATWAAEKRWTGLKSEIDRRRPTRQPATSTHATVTPAAPWTAAPRPARPAPVTADPLTAHADYLEEQGYPFAAAAERKRIADADHQTRRRQVEAEVARTERQFQTLRRNFGEHYANRHMEDGL
jgi:hypothetical protein